MTITYTPQYRLANLGSFTAMPSTTLTTATFTPLAAGTSYDFRIVADNGVGKSTSVPFTQMTTAVSESAQNASITQGNYTTTFIYDANLTQWSLQTPNSFSVYESPPPYTNLGPAASSNSVVLLLYWNHTVYQENSGGGWWSWNGTGWATASDPRPSIVSINLSNNTFPQGAGAATVVGNVTVTENTGNTFSGSLGVTGTDGSKFTINSSNQLVTVGNVPAGGPWSINIVATSNQLAVQNSPFTQAESITETGGESIEGAVVNTVGPIMYASTNFGNPSTGTLNQFELQTSTSSGNQIYINTGSGFVLTPSASVSQLVYHKNTVFQQNNVGGWWYWNTTVAFPANNPWTAFSIDSVALGATTYPTGATAGTQIGAITIGETGGTFGGTFGGTLALSGLNASLFRISGTNLVVNTGVTLSTNTTTNYSFTITATVASGGASPTTIGTNNTGTITLTNSKATTTVTAPSQAVNAGFTRPAFNDDFTTQSVATSAGATSGFNWYWTYATPTYLDPSSWSVNTTLHAANVPIVTSAGPNASANGGILTISGVRAAGYTGVVKNAFLQSCPIQNTVPTFGVWQHCYFEAYIALDPSALGTAHDSIDGFPAFWSWGAEGMQGLGDSTSLNQTSTEIDFFEEYSGILWGGSPPAVAIGTTVCHVVYPAGQSVYGEDITLPKSDAEWHTYGCLWTNGNVKFYKDNVQSGSAGGVDVSGTSIDGFHQFLVLGTGAGWPVYVDWVRVWTA